MGNENNSYDTIRNATAAQVRRAKRLLEVGEVQGAIEELPCLKDASADERRRAIDAWRSS